jgi:GTP cyclohydrolase II
LNCARCRRAVFTYQKDGYGPLFRCYFDRIVAPESLATELETLAGRAPEEIPPLTCPECQALIGEVMRYRNGRLAYLLYQGTYTDDAERSDAVLDEISSRTGISRQRLTEAVAGAREALAPPPSFYVVYEHGAERQLTVSQRGRGPVQTPFATFTHTALVVDDIWRHYSVLTLGDAMNAAGDPLLLRIDSGCETGQMFVDRTCECWEQLIASLRLIAEAGSGALVALREQEGRGMGLAFKLATLQLQEELGLNTVDAASALAGSAQIDIRTYSGVAAVLQAVGIPKIRRLALLSNNPRKSAALIENGYTIAEQRPLVVKPTPHTRPHLVAKAERLGHISLLEELKRL